MERAKLGITGGVLKIFRAAFSVIVTLMFAAAASAQPTNGLWLKLTGVSNGLAHLVLHNSTGAVYEVCSKTNLILPEWNLEQEVWAATNQDWTPFTISMLDRPSLFVWARDWTDLDENSNSIPDWWEYKYFGRVGLDPDADPDGDGFSNRQEYQNGTDPGDWYNGHPPDLEMAGGNRQTGVPGSFLPLPLTVRVTGSDLNPLTNAPVRLVAWGGAQLAATTNAGLETSLSLRTDSNGLVSAWIQLPAFLPNNILFAAASAASGSNTVQTNFIEFTGRRVPLLAVGEERIMELTTEGGLTSWGGNPHEEFGDYTRLDSDAPVHVVGLTNLVKIVSGLRHSLAIDADGSLWAWGDNTFGELGDGSTNGRNVPVRVLEMTNPVVSVAGGCDHSVVVRADGTVWTWGNNESGQLGIGNTAATTLSVPVAGVTNAVAVAAGYSHTLALLDDGTVWAWGDDSFNQLGDGNWNSSSTPVPVPSLTNITAICAGGNHSLALDASGHVWAWGINELFHPDIVVRPPVAGGKLARAEAEANDDWPALVAGLANVVGIAAGASHSLAVDGDGGLWAWGRDDSGQLGDGGLVGYTDAPIQVANMTNIVSIAAGSDASVALDGNGNVWQCGANDMEFYYSRNEPPASLRKWGDEKGLPRLAPNYVDFYNGQLPGLEILSGNDQTPHAGLEFAQPLVFRVTDTNGAAFSNAPVSVEVITGDMELRTVSGGADGKGLRLTTDTDGEVTLTGYTDRQASQTHCLVRVLAASRERIVEADFHETLIPLPAIHITSPEDGGLYLVGSNQPLTITVDAQAAPGASIQEVDYSCQTDGGDNTLLAVSTQSPYSFTWTNGLWWTNAFVGQYTLSAVAVDDAGARSDPQSVNITIALDSDGHGLPDYWQLQYFGHLGIDPDADPDGDGLNNLEEYQWGADPTDYYNGAFSKLEIVSGNDQDGIYDSYLPSPVTLRVTDAYSAVFADTPVTFTVTGGTALLAATTNDAPASTLTLWTDTNGQVSAWVYFPPAGANPPDSTISVTASKGADSVIVNEFVPLGHWRFNDTNTWVGEAGQWPLLDYNVSGVPSWSSNAVLVDSGSPVVLAYNVVETNGRTNIACQSGSVRFWFKPDWSSATAGGNGPGAWGRLIEMGGDNPASAGGWWSLYLSPDGNQLSFSTSAGGGGMTNLSANISWPTGEWQQIALTYSPTGSALFVDGQLLATGAGVTDFPNADELANGFRIGSDPDGNNRAGGAFDELETFDYPLAAANTATCGSAIPDWWEVKYFGRTGLDPDSNSTGASLLCFYQNGKDPNVIDFSLSGTKRFVNNSVLPLQLNILQGEPFLMALAVRTNGFAVTPSQEFDVDSNFTDVTWQPYNPNVVAALNSGDGDYNVWIGLRGASPDGHITWGGTKITLKTVPLVLVITSPAGGTVSKPVIQLLGGANQSLSSLTYDVSNAAGIWTNQTGYATGQFYDTSLKTFTTNWFQCYNVALATNGVNLITLHAADLAGNMTTTNMTVIFDASADTNPPALAVLWPPDGAQISGGSFTLRAQVDDPMLAVSASIVDAGGHTNTAQGLVEQSGLVWVQNLPLATGANALTVTATDAAGNAAATNLTVFQSGVIVTMNPLAGGQLNQSSVSVSGTVSDPGGSVTVNGVAATVNPDGTWAADNVPAGPSGMAIFDVEIHPGGAPNLVRPSLLSAPRDAFSGGDDAGSQSFALAQPVKVGLMSYSGNESDEGVMHWDGQYPEIGSGSYPFWNGTDSVNWTWQSGGSDSGDYFYSGQWNWYSVVDGWKIDSWNNPLPAGDDAFNATWGNVSFSGEIGNTTEEYDAQTRVMIEPQGQTAAGTMATYLVRAQAWDFSWLGTGEQLPPDSMKIQGVTLTASTNEDGSVWGNMLLTAPAGATPEVTPTAPGSYTFTVQATNITLALAADNNRDGAITFDAAGQSNPDQTTANKPYRFWINDSKEHGDDESVIGADDQIPGSSPPNYNSNHAQGRSDYVNFFPVALCLSNTLQLLPPSSGYEYRLYQADGAVKFVYTSLTSTNAFDCLTNSAAPTDYGAIAGYDPSFGPDSSGAITYTTLDAADVVQVPASALGVALNTNFLAQLQDNGGAGVLLVEGCAPTARPLMLEIWRDGKLLTGVPLYLSLSGVEQMFRHLNFSYVNGSVEVPARAGAPNEPPTNGKNFVFLHGYNVNQQEARGVLSEMFKRLYWSGSKAAFYGVTWNGAVSQGELISDISCNLQTNIVNALLTAPHLAGFLGTLSGETTVAAHSLGNIVVLSAISDYNARINNYFMIDSAVAIEAIDGSVVTNADMVHPDWANYQTRLWASEWHSLFSTDDGRSTLTWRDRFSNLSSATEVYNFYSSGEEVLRDFPGAPPDDLASSISTIISEWWQGTAVASYAWVWQEKNKGRMRGNNFISSNHGGWRFNNYSTNYYWTIEGGDGGLENVRLAPADAALLPNSELQTNAFFDMSVDSALFTTDSSGSTYAQANRDRILSDAIPALTSPAGANHVDKLAPENEDDRNFDMQANFENQWPSARGQVQVGAPAAGEWHHSDFDYVAYPFTYRLFNNIVTIGNLQ